MSLREVVANVCVVRGHKVESLVINDVVTPKDGAVLHQYHVACIQCGLTPQEIKKLRRGRKEKAK